MARTIRARDNHRECELAGDPYARKRPYANAIAPATWGRARKVAAALGLSPRTVEGWAEPTSHLLGPVYQLERVMIVALEDGADEADALAPLHFLIDRFLRNRDGADTVGIVRSSASAVREANEGLACALEAVRDHQVTEAEYRKSDRELREGIAHMERVRSELRAAAGVEGSAANR